MSLDRQLRSSQQEDTPQEIVNASEIEAKWRKKFSRAGQSFLIESTSEGEKAKVVRSTRRQKWF